MKEERKNSVDMGIFDLVTEIGKSYAKPIKEEFKLNDYDIKVYHTINGVVIPDLLDMCNEFCEEKEVAVGFRLALAIISAVDASLRGVADEALDKIKALDKKCEKAHEEIDIKINGGTVSGKKAEKVLELLKELGIEPEEE